MKNILPKRPRLDLEGGPGHTAGRASATVDDGVVGGEKAQRRERREALLRARVPSGPSSLLYVDIHDLSMHKTPQHFIKKEIHVLY